MQEMSLQRKIVIKNIPNLHAKVIVSDKNKAIVSSSNLTCNGFQTNIEFGVELNGELAQDLYEKIQEYWNDADAVKLLPGVDAARKDLSSFQAGERKKEVPEIPIYLGKTIKPKGIDVIISHQPNSREINVIQPKVQALIAPEKRHNLLYNVWWNDNDFKGPCLDISNKTVCRNFFLKRDKIDRTQECEIMRGGCDSAYIFSNYAYYVNANLDEGFLNKCAFFFSKNPTDNRYWIIGFFLIKEIGKDFNYTQESGETIPFDRYIKGDEKFSLYFHPYIPLNEKFIMQLSLGAKWGKRDTTEINWITHHTRSSASCTYLSNADAAKILETYKDFTKNPKEKEIVTEVLGAHFYKTK